MAMRRRFALVRALLPNRAERIVEVGFGSGVFMPDLASKCHELYGIDVHSHVEQVQSMLRQRGVHATLYRQDAARMDFPDSFFDLIVAVSALEFIHDIDAAARQMNRVLKNGGCVVAVMPAKSRILDSMLYALTGANAEKDYGQRREQTLPAMLRYFTVRRKLTFGPIYRAYQFERRNTEEPHRFTARA